MRTTSATWSRRGVMTVLASWLAGSASAEGKIPLIGYLSGGDIGGSTEEIEALLQGLSEERFQQDRSFTLEKRFANNDRSRLDALARELVALRPAVIVAGGRPAAEAVRDLRTPIPTLFYLGNDPVALGMVASLSRPGGSMTGFANMNASLNTKRFELLLQLIPTLRKVGWVVHPENPFASTANAQDIRTTGHQLSIQTVVVPVQGAADFLPALRSAREAGVEAVVVANDSMFVFENKALVAACEAVGLPAIASFAMFPRSGGLASYGPPYGEGQRLLGGYAAKILRGASPAELPIIQPQTFEFIVNTAVMKTLGLNISDAVLARASEVVE